MSKRLLRLAAALAVVVMLALPTAAANATSPIGAGLWSSTDTGSTGSDNCAGFPSDSNGFCTATGSGEPSVELGVKFTSSKAVDIVGVRVYRVDGGAVNGSLWGADGTPLAGTGASPAVFSGTSTNSWQDVPFSQAVAITPGQTYVASYNAPTPIYAFEHGFFTNGSYTVGPITALASQTSGGNGVFNYCSPDCFPSMTFDDSNYWVTPLWDSPPTLTVPADMTVDGNTRGGANVTYSGLSASDDEDGPLTPVCTPADGSFFALGSRTVTCSVTDSDRFSVTKSFNVTVQDTKPPTLTLPSDITAEATGPAGAAVSYSASASDLVDGSVSPSCSPASGSTFALGTTTVNCSATDAHGNTATGSFTVTVQDTTPPTLTLPANVTTTAAANSSKVVTFSGSATDLVDGSVAVTCLPASGSTFSVGTTTVSCSATDAHRNTANGSFTVTVNYSWTGFFQPIDNMTTVNTVQAGSGVPVKFSLSGYQGLSIVATGYPKLSTLACSALGTDPTDAIETTTSGNSGINYDSTNDQYTYVWKTQKGWAGTCGQLDVKLIDNTTHSAYFKFLK